MKACSSAVVKVETLFTGLGLRSFLASSEQPIYCLLFPASSSLLLLSSITFDKTSIELNHLFDSVLNNLNFHPKEPRVLSGCLLIRSL